MGYAADYVGDVADAAAPDGGDFVVATGVSTTIGRMFELAFRPSGSTIGPRGIDPAAAARPADVFELRVNSARARRVLGWAPKTSMEVQHRHMVDGNLRRNRS